jgi:YD repeat-containing protein
MRSLVVFILALISVSVSAQSKKQIKEMKIKSCTETTVLYTEGKETATFKSAFSAFDKEGNTTEEIQYNQDGSVKRRETAKYAGKNKTEEVVDSRGDKDTEGNKTNYRKTTYKYNANGDKTEETDYDAAGNVVKRTTYTYTKSGDKQFEVIYDASGKLIKKIVYGYDVKGLRISKSTYGPGDVLIKMVKYTYGY